MRGRVVDARGAAVADADVYAAPDGRSSGIPLEDLDPSTSPWAARTHARTDATGRFQIDSVRNASARLVVRARAFARLERSMAPRADDLDLGDVVLVDGLVLSGRVVDVHDRPIADAVLRSLPFDAKPAVILGSASGDVVARSDADGAFRIDDLPEGPWLLSIRAQDRPDKLERGDTRTDPASTARKIVMADGAEIRGRVTQAPAGILETLWVRAVPTGAPSGSAVPSVARVDEELMLATPRTARIVSDGTFVVRGLTAGVAYRLAARDGENDSFARARTNRVEARAGDQDVELVYLPDHALVFQVVDGQTQAPVEDFEARFGHGFLQPLPRSRDAAAGSRHPDGRVRAELGSGMRAGDTFDLVVESIGHAPLRLADVRVPQGDIDLGVLRLERAPSITVTVLDAGTHTPVKGAHVTFGTTGATPQPDGGPSGTGTRDAATTDEHGVARLNLDSERAARLMVRHPDYAASIGDEIGEAPAGEIARTVLLARGGRVVVEVLDALGTPARGVRVRHDGVRGEIEPPADALASGARTDARGELAFTHLESGDHQFEVEHEVEAQDPGDPSRRAHASVTEGGDVRVTLRVPARARLTGRVTAGGQPLVGATLRLAPRDAGQSADDALTARTNGFGEFTLSSLPMGAYDASIVHPTRAMTFVARLGVNDVQARFDVDLPIATITGRIVDAAGNSVVGVRVRVEADAPKVGSLPPTEDPASRFVTAADGTFELRGVQVDVDLVVRVDDGEHRPARSGIVRVAANETRSNVDLVLADGAPLEVTVFAVDGDPVRFARVLANSGALAREATSDAVGTARFRGLAPGTWRIAVDVPARYGVLSGEPTVELKSGAENRVRIDLR